MDIAVQAPQGTYIRIAPRSRVAAKGVAVLGGVVDANNRGEVKAMLFNTSTNTLTFTCGDRVAQLIPTKVGYPQLAKVRC